MKNKLIDLNNILFTQLERLSEKDLKGDELKNEAVRAELVARLAREIISNGHLALKAKISIKECLIEEKETPLMLREENEADE